MNISDNFILSNIQSQILMSRHGDFNTFIEQSMGPCNEKSSFTYQEFIQWLTEKENAQIKNNHVLNKNYSKESFGKFEDKEVKVKENNLDINESKNNLEGYVFSIIFFLFTNDNYFYSLYSHIKSTESKKSL